ncbi:hypothetical protein AEAC466_12435 [Asticcacaulis sp. AC466]|nr:hypothetical protein AEAC466_12435 [Asticcacaulis sp. AC466]
MMDMEQIVNMMRFKPCLEHVIIDAWSMLTIIQNPE